MLAALPLVGMAGFWAFGKREPFDALYMAVTTITTVGYGEIPTPLPRAGRVFVMCYLVLGLGVFTYSLFSLGEMAYRAGLAGWWERRRMDSTLHSMRGHFIICGFGRMGRSVCSRLAEQGVPFVVIDRSDDRVAGARERGWPWLLGDATDDETLTSAGIAHARGLAAVLGEDAENVYLVLSARLLAPKLQIIARAGDEQSVPKLQKAGATKIVGLHETGASKVAQLMLSPNLDQLIQIFQSKGLELDLAEIEVAPGAPYAGQTLDHTDFRSRGVTVVAIRRANGQLLLPPESSSAIHPHDRLIALGRSEAIAGLLKS